MPLDAIARAKVLREASRVQRCHTTSIHGTYTVGQHSYGAVNLLLCLHPNPSVNLIKAVLWHDVHERYLGDIPGPAKWMNGEFTKLYEQMAAQIERTCGIEIRLEPDERCWLDAVDKTELLVWAKEQLAMGNTNAASILGNLASWFANHPIPVQVKKFIEEYDISRGADGIPR
jgi:5'-deoxynucleotidase YfbR-like HD superfamily hydrolase